MAKRLPLTWCRCVGVLHWSRPPLAGRNTPLQAFFRKVQTNCAYTPFYSLAFHFIEARFFKTDYRHKNFPSELICFWGNRSAMFVQNKKDDTERNVTFGNSQRLLIFLCLEPTKYKVKYNENARIEGVPLLCSLAIEGTLYKYGNCPTLFFLCHLGIGWLDPKTKNCGA